ncbi:MAG TPA: hypothetical protein VN956_26130 [Pyrinomonadaceae bacterium]|nr:hypothetical protein [Pyrinomonadaceae bacterium]
MRPLSLNHKSALVIAHPGHELLVYNWLSLANPYVFVLTDGSGHSHKSRLHRTTSIINSLGARPGSIYGRLTDADAYSAILAGEVGVFIRMASELAEALVHHRIEYIVGDAIEGYNPVHDICRLIINAAVKKVCQMGHCLANFDVSLAYQHDLAQKSTADIVSIAASEQMLAEKLQVARDYSELAVDVNRIIAQEGVTSLGIEYLRPVNENSYQRFQEQPYYEVYGERQVAAGRYQQVIRYRDHVLPIGEALKDLSRGLAVR